MTQYHGLSHDTVSWPLTWHSIMFSHMTQYHGLSLSHLLVYIRRWMSTSRRPPRPAPGHQTPSSDALRRSPFRRGWGGGGGGRSRGPPQWWRGCIPPKWRSPRTLGHNNAFTAILVKSKPWWSQWWRPRSRWWFVFPPTRGACQHGSRLSCTYQCCYVTDVMMGWCWEQAWKWGEESETDQADTASSEMAPQTRLTQHQGNTFCVWSQSAWHRTVMMEEIFKD